ncbi:MAG: 1-(5-phosphoribosyl)-5-[Solobacterium sp.]|nr:1-(5-phosphoribosyl)-5-[(5-phosphoribosylamino)methylideneamino]imidazole-4-carboxamide isomerase [Solobacterium sp.]
MIVLPAIDIMDGKPVRLFQGRFDEKTVVAESVRDTALRFDALGADFLHVVDLDGARFGSRRSFDTIIDAIQAVKMPVEVGGGIRTMEDIERYLEGGAARVILGTAAIEHPELVKEAVSRYGEKIAVGIDCKDGLAAGSGWLSVSRITYLELAKSMEEIGVRTVIVTDISKDGTLNGPNTEMLKQLQKETSLQLVASGGIRDLSHIQELAELGIYGAITGKAIYTGTLDLSEAIAVCRRESC